MDFLRCAWAMQNKYVRTNTAEANRLLSDGWEMVGENGGLLWQLHRGGRTRSVITDVRIAPGGKELLVKIEEVV
jgi:hypothetical protein